MPGIKSILRTLFVVLICCGKLQAQEFTGYVKRLDTLVIPVYQAHVQISCEDKELSNQKTYFNGAYTFATGKNKTYTIKISFPGYADTTFDLTTDKNGKPVTADNTVILHKDGMRFVGVLRGIDKKFPIADATIVLKNIMTRQESRQTTSIDGAYNFKLEYETNYSISIDKHSPGMANKYKDTTFHITTIGFNLPLDYKQDIYVEKLAHPEPEDFSAGRQPFKKTTGNTAPAETQALNATVAAGSGNISTPVSTTRYYPTAKAVADTNAAPVNSVPAAVKVKADTITSPLTIAREAAVDSINELRAAAEKKSQGLKAQKLYSDSAVLAAVKMAKQHLADSVAKVKSDLVALQKLKQDSIAGVKLAKDKIAKDIATKKMYDDSVMKVQLIARKQAVADSVNKVKLQQQLAAKEAAAKKAMQDSIVIAQLLAHNLAVTDSVNKVKLQQQIAAKEAAAKKATADSISKANLAAALASKTSKQDSIDKAYAEAVRHKQVRDSLAAITKKMPSESYVVKMGPMDSATEQIYSARKKLNDLMVRLTAQQKNLEIEIKAGQIEKDTASAMKTAPPVRKVEDSIYLLKQVKRYNLIQDSINLVNVALVNIARQLKGANGSSATVYPSAIATETAFADLPAVFFSKNSDTLNKAQKANLQEIIKMLVSDKKSKVRLYGLASADEDAHQQLATKRNDAIIRNLLQAGIESARIKTAQAGNKTSRNYCENTNCPEDLQKQNRCVVMEVVKE